MKCLLVTPGYPSKENIYNNGFVHSRVKEYKKLNVDVDVFSVDKKSNSEYTYDGVDVITGDYNNLKNKIIIGNYDIILVHFGWKKIMKTIIKNINKDTKIIQWVHGVEALGWYRRLFNLRLNFKEIIKFCGYIVINTRQMLYLRQLILNQEKYNIHFVFVSVWMKNIVEKDTLTKNKIKHFDIVPNVVDSTIFNYVEKNEEMRYKIFNVRTYDSKKYANDIVADVIIELSKRDIFDKLDFNLYGDGRLFDEITSRICKFENVHINKGYLKQSEIVEKHKKNGVLLMPTRQDAQGVSMCEAMSSGLVPVVSNNTAIPEYASNDVGYLSDNHIQMADAIEELANNPLVFKEKSKKASKYIQSKCATEIVIKKEINIMNIRRR